MDANHSASAVSCVLVVTNAVSIEMEELFGKNGDQQNGVQQNGIQEAEIIGISARAMRRWRARYQEYGYTHKGGLSRDGYFPIPCSLFSRWSRTRFLTPASAFCVKPGKKVRYRLVPSSPITRLRKGRFSSRCSRDLDAPTP